MSNDEEIIREGTYHSAERIKLRPKTEVSKPTEFSIQQNVSSLETNPPPPSPRVSFNRSDNWNTVDTDDQTSGSQRKKKKSRWVDNWGLEFFIVAILSSYKRRNSPWRFDFLATTPDVSWLVIFLSLSLFSSPLPPLFDRFSHRRDGKQ